MRPALRHALWGLIPITAAGIAAGQNLLLVPGPLTACVIRFDLLAATVTVAVTLLTTAAVALVAQ